MQRPIQVKVVCVRDPRHYLRAEQAMSRTERGKDIALSENRAAHGQVRGGPVAVFRITIAAARTWQRTWQRTLVVFGIVRRQNGGRRGKEVERHGRACLSSLVKFPTEFTSR